MPILRRGGDGACFTAIPYGAKDLLAVAGYRTTWGSVPFRDQVIDATAAVVERLDAAGAVLVAKTAVGELAWGDVWFDGMCRNPWKLDQGLEPDRRRARHRSVAAGCVSFRDRHRDLGSIVSPSTRCGVTGLRPTFGRVSRHGAMALSWTMDKVGPIARTVGDCALAFETIHGAGRARSVLATASCSRGRRRATSSRSGSAT